MALASGVFNELEGLAERLDSSRRIRERLRDIGQFLAAKPAEGQKEAAGPISKTNDNLRNNVDAMMALVQVMHGVMDRVPCLDALEGQIEKLYESHGITCSKEWINQQAWTMRYLFGVLKQHTYKKKITKEPWQHQGMIEKTTKQRVIRN